MSTPTVEGLLEQLGDQLRLAPLGPDPDFRDSLRRRLVAVATVSPAPSAARTSPPVRVSTRVSGLGWARPGRGWRIAIGGAGMALTVAGVTAAGVLALPGDAFYGVKHGEEHVELALAGSDEAKGLLHLRFARNRLDEVTDLLDRAGVTTSAAGSRFSSSAAGPPALSPHLAALVATTLHEMDVQTKDGATLLTRTYLKERQAAPLAKLTTFTEQQTTHLQAVSAVLPAKAQPAATTSLHLLASVSTSTKTLLVTTPPLVEAPTPPDPGPSTAPTSPSPSGVPSPSASDSPAAPSPADAPPSPSAAGDPSPTASDSPSPAPPTSPSPAADPSPTSPAPASSAPAGPAASPTAASSGDDQTTTSSTSSTSSTTGGTFAAHQVPVPPVLGSVRFS